MKPIRIQRSTVVHAALLLSLALIWSWHAIAQTEESATGSTAQAGRGVQGPAYYQLEETSPAVEVGVLVTDEDGNVVTGLRAGNFRVLDNGTPRAIDAFSPSSAPITITILMEYSAASFGYFAGKAGSWASGFLEHLEPKDWVALMTYDMRSKVQVDFTHRRYEVRDAIQTLGPPQFSEANLFDGMVEALDKLAAVKGRKSILLLSTGMNSFSEATLDEVRERLRNTDTVLFCIGLAEGEYIRSGGSDIEYIKGKAWLSDFAKQTGGIALFPRFDAELPSIFRSVVGFLRNESTLTLRLPKEYRDGKYHRLTVEVIGSDGKPFMVTNAKGRKRKVEVFAREGYMAPMGRSQLP